jgi:4-hydroxy-3-methylbut-2-enyl diphosphate reductase
VIIHGKEEHEETKATFSNAALQAPALVIRNRDHARVIGEIILEDDPVRRRTLFEELNCRHTPGFDPSRDLERIAVVNQTTLLRNETIAIIDDLESVLSRKFGSARIRHHLYGQSRGDTLCYATQVNQDALGKALPLDPDLAIVVGGRNSSNTYQLYRVCAQTLGSRAFYIQSERNILSAQSIEHHRFPSDPADPEGGSTKTRPFLPNDRPLTILVTGGASCPDGIIQMVIERINRLLADEDLRSIDEVLKTAMA